MKLTAGERFWPKVDKSGPVPAHRPELGPCWIWIASRTDLGYGKFGVGTALGWVGAHRFAYELLAGPIPAGLTLDHLCRNTSCVNPVHLEPVTSAENVRRAAAAITHCPAGHPYDEANTRIVKGGYRQCRTCDRERARLLRDYQGLVYGGTHCRHGHEYTPENTRIRKGTRHCRACDRDATRRYRAKD